jgi:hypothetical protein
MRFALRIIAVNRAVSSTGRRSARPDSRYTCASSATSATLGGTTSELMVIEAPS